ncbi:nucleolar protein 4-like isoform X2 [Amblyomma americanum]
MEKRLHNTRHAARQARNSTGKAGSAGNSTTSGASSAATAEKTTSTTTTIRATAATSAPSPPPVSMKHEQRDQQVTVTASSTPRYRHHQQQVVQQNGDSSDEDEDEEMDDDAASPPLATPASSPSTPVTPTAAGGGSSQAPPANPEQMYEGFQAWALRTYGDSAKTKTVTRKKYQRILKILKGEEQTSAENSKFRFWVKAKGFKMGLPPGHPQQSVHKAALAAAAAKTPPEQLLFVPCSKVKKGSDGETTVYKRVAVVENFFEIIYGVHVEMDGRGGKHAGQKRTYKAIAELYAFLPREAVTHFLMSCSDCQKRMHLTNGALSVVAPAAAPSNADTPALNSSGNCSNNGAATPAAAVPPPPTTTTAGSPGYQGNSCNNNSREAVGAGATSCRPGSRASGRSSPSRDVTACAGGAPTTPAASSAASSPGGASSDAGSAPAARAAAARIIAPVSAADLDFSVPITTAYLKHMRSLGLSDEDAFNPREDSTLGSDELSDDEATPNYDDDDGEASPDAAPLDSKEAGGEGGDVCMADAASTPGGSEDGAASTKAPSPAGRRASSAEEAMDTQQPLNMTAKPATSSIAGGFVGSVGAAAGSAAGEHGFSERGTSPPAGGGASGEPDDLSAGTKEDLDEEDDDDEQDKLDISSYDPERLKAFNMFVRLFVDENLDRMVPISRQPKEKIQAIIDSCGRQFPEFAERARKRIRTYLKSCRRTKRTRDLNGWDMELDVPGRSATPGYHVTVSVGGTSGSALSSIPSSLPVNSSSSTNNVSSQLISRLTAPIVTSSANGLLPASTALSAVSVGSSTLNSTNNSAITTSGVEVTTVCPFHMHHHHHQQFHQHFTTASTNPPSVSSNGTILTSPAMVTSSSSSSPVTSFVNGASPHTHTHHHHKCFNNNLNNVVTAAATNGLSPVTSMAVAANGHHYSVHHRHVASTTGPGSNVVSSPASCNSPTDLSVKKCNGVDRPAVALKYSLNPTEVNAVKQLIAGYRESAAFLLRSADELEQLLLQQN